MPSHATGDGMSSSMIEITRLAKAGGPLTKRISLGPDGRLISDGSACVMSRGTACRVVLDDLDQFAALIDSLGSHEAIALGSLRADLPDRVQLTTATGLASLNGQAAPDLIARTTQFIAYRAGQPALALLDFDRKGMPPEMASRIRDLGGFRSVLHSILPELANAGGVIRASTSAGIRDGTTGERFEGAGGLHLFLLVADGQDIERFLRALHRRCWLAGFGWLMVGAGGQLLERSIVDRMVGSPERLVFEGAPVLEPPLTQDRVYRQPRVIQGGAIDTRRACPDLKPGRGGAIPRAAGRRGAWSGLEAAHARRHFIERHAAKIAARFSLSPRAAQRIVERQTEGVLLPNIELVFDDPDLRGSTVADVLADPEDSSVRRSPIRWKGLTTAPAKRRSCAALTGPYGFHSFADGRTVYELRHDARLGRSRFAAEPNGRDVPEVFARLSLAAELTRRRDRASPGVRQRRSGLGKRAIDATVEAARARQTEQRAREEEQRRAAERTDPRLRMPAPGPMPNGCRSCGPSITCSGKPRTTSRRCAIWMAGRSKSARANRSCCTS